MTVPVLVPRFLPVFAPVKFCGEDDAVFSRRDVDMVIFVGFVIAVDKR